jgi:ribosomal protein S18 acetylase RimI-like enzyme
LLEIIPNKAHLEYVIRQAWSEEFERIGRLTVDIYANLPSMPTRNEQPEYYSMVQDVAKRASNPAIRIFAAIAPPGEILGSVDFIHDMTQYGSGGSASQVPHAAGMRLLAVDDCYKGKGIGKALTQRCIKEARHLGKKTFVLHTTQAMQIAWAMYEGVGFKRFPSIDFKQENLDVFGFSLDLT